MWSNKFQWLSNSHSTRSTFWKIALSQHLLCACLRSPENSDSAIKLHNNNDNNNNNSTAVVRMATLTTAALFCTLHVASLLPLVTRLPVQGVGLPKCDRMQSICNISFSLFSLTLFALWQLTAAKAQQMWQLLLHEHALIAQVQRANKTEHNYERIA